MMVDILFSNVDLLLYSKKQKDSPFGFQILGIYFKFIQKSKLTDLKQVPF